MLPAKLPSKQLQVIWYSVINSIIHQWWSGKCYCLLPKYLYLTRTWLKKYLMYLMSSKYSEYLNLYLYLQIWKSTCTWLKYFEKYLTPTLILCPGVTILWDHYVSCLHSMSWCCPPVRSFYEMSTLYVLVLQSYEIILWVVCILCPQPELACYREAARGPCWHLST